MRLGAFFKNYTINNMKIKRVVGIDPGKHTAIAILNLETGELEELQTMMIHNALEYVDGMLLDSYIVVEDAHKWDNKDAENYEERKQGAGSIKRDCTIWKDYLKDNEAFFAFNRPQKNSLKNISHSQFKKLTGWVGRTNEHNRAAAMMILGYESGFIEILYKQFINTQ